MAVRLQGFFEYSQVQNTMKKNTLYHLFKRWLPEFKISHEIPPSLNTEISMTYQENEGAPRTVVQVHSCITLFFMDPSPPSWQTAEEYTPV